MRIRTISSAVAVIAALAMVPVGVAFAAGHASARTAKTHSKPFSSSGQGTEQSLSASGCQNVGPGCVVRTTGTARTAHFGRGSFTTTLTIEWSANYSNGKGGFCAPATGPSVLKASHGQINLQDTGTVCEVGKTGFLIPHVFFGTFTITGGTGRDAGATGSGHVYGGDDGIDTFAYTAFGTFTP